MRWLFNVLSWNFTCLALALLVLGSIPFAAKVMADSPPPTTGIGGPNPYCHVCSGNTPPCDWWLCLGDPECPDLNIPCDPSPNGGCEC